VEAIVTDCATCGSLLKGYSDKVRDISQFLLSIDFKPRHWGINKVITYHLPCHLGWGLGVKEEPLRLLKLIPEVELIELKEADACCGGAGSYFLHFPDLSNRILQRKISHIAQTRAEVVVTSCPSCQFHLKRGIKRARLPLQVVHLSRLLHAG
jgi:glycolate oxidase iron-sulfur subunit